MAADHPFMWVDAFTGTAKGGMACYLWSKGLIARPRFVAEQGHWMGRPDRAEVGGSGAARRDHRRARRRLRCCSDGWEGKALR